MAFLSRNDKFFERKGEYHEKALALVIAVILAVFALCACGAPGPEKRHPPAATRRQGAKPVKS